MSSRKAARLDKEAYMQDTFRPKDELSFAPTTGNSQIFETEWVVDGEGWLGNVSSTKPIVGMGNLPLSYIDPISTIMTQPRGLHSIRLADDNDSTLGEDSPYFSLTDFIENRGVRAWENDVVDSPVPEGWNQNVPVVF